MCVCVCIVKFNEFLLLAAGFAVTCCTVHDDPVQWSHHRPYICLPYCHRKGVGAAVKVEHVAVMQCGKCPGEMLLCASSFFFTAAVVKTNLLEINNSSHV